MDILEYGANIDNKDFLQEEEILPGSVEVLPPPPQTEVAKPKAEEPKEEPGDAAL